MTLGAGLLLIPMLARAPGGGWWQEKLRYGLIAGALGVGIPTAIVVIVSLHAGVGLTSVAYAFPPLLTWGLSVVLRMERGSWRCGAGLIVSLAGALIISWPPEGLFNPWMALARVASISLAAGKESVRF